MTTATKTTTANPFASLGEALETAAEHFEEGSANARQSAKNAAGTTQRIFKVGLYNTAYGLSYGLVFATVYLTEMLPKDGVLRRGLEEGADAAFEAQSKVKVKEEEEAEEVEIKQTARQTKKGVQKRKSAARGAEVSVDAES
jgi:hypothetical protein